MAAQRRVEDKQSKELWGLRIEGHVLNGAHENGINRHTATSQELLTNKTTREAEVPDPEFDHLKALAERGEVEPIMTSDLDNIHEYLPDLSGLENGPNQVLHTGIVGDPDNDGIRRSAQPLHVNKEFRAYPQRMVTSTNVHTGYGGQVDQLDSLGTTTQIPSPQQVTWRFAHDSVNALFERLARGTGKLDARTILAERAFIRCYTGRPDAKYRTMGLRNALMRFRNALFRNPGEAMTLTFLYTPEQFQWAWRNELKPRIKGEGVASITTEYITPKDLARNPRSENTTTYSPRGDHPVKENTLPFELQLVTKSVERNLGFVPAALANRTPSLSMSSKFIATISVSKMSGHTFVVHAFAWTKGDGQYELNEAADELLRESLADDPWAQSSGQGGTLIWLGWDCDIVALALTFQVTLGKHNTDVQPLVSEALELTNLEPNTHTGVGTFVGGRGPSR